MSQQQICDDGIAEANAVCVQTVENVDELGGWGYAADEDRLGGDETILYL